MEEVSESTFQVVPQLVEPQLVVLLKETSVVLPRETSVARPLAELLERLTLFSLAILASRLRSGTSSSSSVNAERSLK